MWKTTEIPFAAAADGEGRRRPDLLSAMLSARIA